MSTIADLATRALQRLTVLVSGETAQTADLTLCVDAFNGMVNGWFGDGLTPVADETATTLVPLVEGTVYTSSSDFPLLDRHFEGVAAMLAVAVAEDFETPPRAVLARDAQRAEQRIYAAFMPSMITRPDRALLRLNNSLLWPGSDS